MNKILAFLPIIIFILGCVQQDSANNSQMNNTQIVNPSAAYCIEQGCTYESRSTIIGNNGYCIFEDGSECEAWAYFRDECSKESASTCKYLCGDGVCQEMVCMAIGCPCAESYESCPIDCQE